MFYKCNFKDLRYNTFKFDIDFKDLNKSFKKITKSMKAITDQFKKINDVL